MKLKPRKDHCKKCGMKLDIERVFRGRSYFVVCNCRTAILLNAEKNHLDILQEEAIKHLASI